MGVRILRALLFGVYIRAPDFGKLPNMYAALGVITLLTTDDRNYRHGSGHHLIHGAKHGNEGPIWEQDDHHTRTCGTQRFKIG